MAHKQINNIHICAYVHTNTYMYTYEENLLTQNNFESKTAVAQKTQ